MLVELPLRHEFDSVHLEVLNLGARMSCSWTPYLFSNLVMVMSLRSAFVRLQSLIFMPPCFRLLTTIRVTWCQSANCSIYLLSTQILSFDTAMVSFRLRFTTISFASYKGQLGKDIRIIIPWGCALSCHFSCSEEIVVIQD